LQAWLQANVEKHPWLQHMQKEHGFPQDTPVVTDSASAPQLAVFACDFYTAEAANPRVDIGAMIDLRGVLLTPI